MRSWALVTVSLIAATVSAQSGAPPRGRAVGLVTDARGAPVAAADVVLWSWPLPGRIDVGEPDRVTVKTGTNGRFSADIFDGRSYSAYALWHDDLGAHCSVLEPDVMPGSPRILSEAPPRILTTVALRGVAAWRDLGPLQVTHVIGVLNPLVTPLAMDAKHEAGVPAGLPPGPTWIDVCTSTGRLICSSALAGDPASALHTIALPGVQRCIVIAEDREGQAVADAEVHVLHDFGYHGVSSKRRVFAPDFVGKTGKNGDLTVFLPGRHPVEGETQLRTSLLVSARDHQRQCVDVMLMPSEGSRVRARLRSGVDVRGRFVDQNGAPVTAGIVPLFESYAQLNSGHGFGGFVPLPPMPMAISADGAFFGHGLHASTGVRVFAVVDPARAQALGLPLRADFGVPPVFPLALETRSPGNAGLDLGDVRLDRLRLARLAVVDHNGAPLTGVRLRVSRGRGFGTPIDFLADRMGRLQLPLPAGDFRIGAFVPGGGVASIAVQVPADVVGDRPIDLQLTEPRQVHGVVAGAGQGLAAPSSGGLRVVLADVDCGNEELAFLARSAVTISVPAASDGAFVMTVPFGNARYALQARNGNAVGAFGDGEKLEMVVQDTDVTGVTVPAPASR